MNLLHSNSVTPANEPRDTRPDSSRGFPLPIVGQSSFNVSGLTMLGPDAAMSRSESIGQLVAARPTRARILEKWGLPYCCSRHQSLTEACAERGIDVRAVLAELRESDARALGLPHCEHGYSGWRHAPLADFVAHLSEMHHAYLREELTRLSGLLARVADDHGAYFTELWEMEALFLELEQKALSHLEIEEEQLFPLLRRLDTDAPIPAYLVEMMRNMIEGARKAHEDVRGLLRELRELSNNFQPVETACITYRVLMYGIAELEVEVQRHFGEEEENLFPRILERLAR